MNDYNAIDQTIEEKEYPLHKRAIRRSQTQTKFINRKARASRTWGTNPMGLVKLKNTPHFCDTCCNQHWSVKKYGFTNKLNIQKVIASSNDQLKELNLPT